MMMRNLPVETDWDELFFLAHKFLGLTMNEFLYDYNQELITYMLDKNLELMTGKENNEPEVETIEARNLFSGLGF